MLLQERHAFFLESPGPVMFGLVLDVIDSLGQMRNTHAKSAVTVLPCKIVQRRMFSE
jgi:hypothetical protein